MQKQNQATSSGAQQDLTTTIFKGLGNQLTRSSANKPETADFPFRLSKFKALLESSGVKPDNKRKKAASVGYQAAPVALPLLINDKDIIQRKRTIEVFGVPKPVNINLQRRSSLNDGSSPSSKKGTMFVTELWSEKHLKKIKIKSGVMKQTKEIEKARRTDFKTRLAHFSDYFSKKYVGKHSDLQAPISNEDCSFSNDFSLPQLDQSTTTMGIEDGSSSQQISNVKQVLRSAASLNMSAFAAQRSTTSSLESNIIIGEVTPKSPEFSNDKQSLIKLQRIDTLGQKMLNSPTWKTNFKTSEAQSFSTACTDISQISDSKNYSQALNNIINACSDTVSGSGLRSSYLSPVKPSRDLDKPRFHRKYSIRADNDADDEKSRILDTEEVMRVFANKRKSLFA